MMAFCLTESPWRPTWQNLLRTLYFLPWLLLLINAAAQADPIRLGYEILATRDHDARIFSQGLILNGNVLTETSGLYGKSFLVQYEANSGAVLRRIDLPRDIFAEGITEFAGRLYMLTWQARQALVFDAVSLQQETTLPFRGEGWGITHDGQHLITSDGSNILSWRKPEDFTVVKALPVSDDTKSWHQLNELEYAEQFIWSNVWQDTVILAIDPATGKVKALVDLVELVRPNNQYPGRSVLNGIAYDPHLKAFWVTGKLWPKRYLVRFLWPTTPTPPPLP